MSSLITELKRVSADLQEVRPAWALVGGLACSVYAEPRTTKDIDVVILCKSDAEFEELTGTLEVRGYQKTQLLMHTDPVYRLGFRMFVPTVKQYSVPVDFLHSSCGIEKEIIDSAQKIEILPSLSLPVACLGHLIAMKLLSYNDWDRVQDKADILGLLAVASVDDLNTAKEAIRLITERREEPTKKDLLSELEMFVLRAKQK